MPGQGRRKLGSSHTHRNKKKDAQRKARSIEAQKIHELQEKMDFEYWKANLTDRVKKLLAEGASAEKLRDISSALVQAMIINKAVTEADLSAAKDVLDRHEGKAKERHDIKHQLESLPEEELDALIETELNDVGITQEEIH